jgi:stage II sporulation protein D
MRCRLLAGFILAIVHSFCFAQEVATVIKVSLFNGSKVQQVGIMPQAGNVILQADSIYFHLHSISGYTITLGNDSLSIHEGDEHCGLYSKMTIFLADTALLKIKSIQPLSSERLLNGMLYLTARKGYIETLSEIELDDYVAGVVEAESGISKHKEYYKVQSLICRTYALKNIRKHEAEGFHLCDQEHCQVFKGLSNRTEAIKEATIATREKVLLDGNANFIDAVFSANCGGITANSEDVWGKPFSYLRSVNDAYCRKSKSARWSKEISRTEWVNSIKKNCKNYDPGIDPLLNGSIFNEDNEKRICCYQSGSCNVVLKNIRSELGLKSTFFTAKMLNERIVLRGRGFGHGVGLCQDGAMEMARQGFSYNQIIHFYFTNTSIAAFGDLEFFRSED